MSADPGQGGRDANPGERAPWVAGAFGRIGHGSLITARLVDKKRGTVLDRDDARVAKASKDSIDDRRLPPERRRQRRQGRRRRPRQP